MPPPPVRRDPPKPPPVKPPPAPLQPPKSKRAPATQKPVPAATQPPKDSFKPTSPGTTPPRVQMGPYVPGHEPKNDKPQTQPAPAAPKKEEQESKGLENWETYPKALDTKVTARQQLQDGKDRVQTWKDNRSAGHGLAKTMKEGVKDNFVKSIEGGKNPKDLDNGLGRLGKANTAIKGGVGAYTLVDEKVSDAYKALATGGLSSSNPQERSEALDALASAGKTSTETLKAGLETARDLEKYGSATRAANLALKAAAPDLGLKGRLKIAHNLSIKAFNHADAGDVGTAEKFEALKKASRSSTTDIAAEAHGESNNKAQKRLNQGIKTGAEKTADSAFDAAIEKGAKAAGGKLAKVAGRFVPGANVAVAAFDIATAIATSNSKDASPGKKITAWTTAAGSVLAATNIPVVSQVGAAFSTVSDLVGSFF